MRKEQIESKEWKIETNRSSSSISRFCFTVRITMEIWTWRASGRVSCSLDFRGALVKQGTRANPNQSLGPRQMPPGPHHPIRNKPFSKKQKKTLKCALSTLSIYHLHHPRAKSTICTKKKQKKNTNFWYQ